MNSLHSFFVNSVIPFICDVTNYRKVIEHRDLHALKLMQNTLNDSEWCECWIYAAKNGNLNAIKWLCENKPKYCTCDVMYWLHAKGYHDTAQWLRQLIDRAKVLKGMRRSRMSNEDFNISLLFCHHKKDCKHYRPPPPCAHSGGGMFSRIVADGKADRLLMDTSILSKRKEEINK